MWFMSIHGVGQVLPPWSPSPVKTSRAQGLVAHAVCCFCAWGNHSPALRAEITATANSGPDMATMCDAGCTRDVSAPEPLLLLPLVRIYPPAAPRARSSECQQCRQAYIKVPPMTPSTVGGRIEIGEGSCMNVLVCRGVGAWKKNLSRSPTCRPETRQAPERLGVGSASRPACRFQEMNYHHDAPAVGDEA